MSSGLLVLRVIWVLVLVRVLSGGEGLFDGDVDDPVAFGGIQVECGRAGLVELTAHPARHNVLGRGKLHYRAGVVLASLILWLRETSP